MIRVQTREGQKRVSVQPHFTIKQVKEQIAKEHKIPLEEQELFLRHGLEKPTKLDDSVKLSQCNVTCSGELLILMTPSTETTTPEDPDKQPTQQTSNHVVKIDKKGLITLVEEKKAEVTEDEVDQLLHNVDGWTIKPGAQKKMRKTDDYIAPWAILNHEPWKTDMKIKHIPFHSWVREKTYQSGSNTQPSLVEDQFKSAKVDGKLSGAQLSRATVTINRQTYRHVDLVLFEHKTVVDAFLDPWRETGLQRCGYLLGKYEPDDSIPLGITARVVAIYEPPQKSTKDGVVLLKDANSDKVDDLLKMLGLARVGFIWTSLKVDPNTKQIIADRAADCPLTATEMVRMAHLQDRYPNPWSHSRNGRFGSKFVSVICTGGLNNGVEIEAYQISNQGCALVIEKVIKPVTSKPQFFKVRPSDEQWLNPDLMYKKEDEYHNVVTVKADPYLPVDYFIIGVRHGFPKADKPVYPFFGSFAFPTDNRFPTDPKPAWNDILRILDTKKDPELKNSLLDFNLLLFLAINAPSETLNLVVNFLLPVEPNSGLASLASSNLPTSTSTSTSTNIPSLEKMKSTLYEVVYKQIPSLSSRSAPPQSSITTPKVPAPPSVSMKEKQQIIEMGFTEAQAQEALTITNGNVEQAVNYLFSTQL